MQLDVNSIINDLSAQIAELVKQNAILKATLMQYQKAFDAAKMGQKVTDGGELESA